MKKNRLLLKLILIWIAVCFLISVILLMSGCASNKYQLIIEDGNYYITYDNPSASKSNMGCYAEYTIFYNTTKEMKDAIINVDFTEKQLREFAKRLPHVDGKLKILNIDKLYEATYPTDLDLPVCFHGDSYSWDINSKDGSISVFMDFSTEKEFSTNKIREKYITSQQSYKDISVTVTDDRNATVIGYIDWNGDTIKEVTYTIETAEKTLVILEEHLIKDVHKSRQPYVVNIYGQQAGEYFRVSIYNLTERPSIEWLSQFGIREYVETSTS